MKSEIQITTERVDDLPILIEQQSRMKIPQLMNEHFKEHGNRQGLSIGWMSTVWLSFILSESNHRLSHVQPWAEKCQHTLKVCSQQEIRSEDFTDDRLGDILRALSQDENWQAFEQALNAHTLRAYDLERSPIRLDSTSANGYFEIFEKGIFQYGHSKDHRPDLPQLKIKMSTLDPLGMPLSTTVLPGNRADDPEYIPAVQKVRQSLEQRGLLYVGDSKMASLKTRAFIAKGKDYYLCPLSQKQLSSQELEEYLQPALEGKKELVDVHRTDTNGKEEKIAMAYECTEELEFSDSKKPQTFKERRIIAQSFSFLKAGHKDLKDRLSKAKADLKDLNKRSQGKKRYNKEEELSQDVESIIAKYRVEGLLCIEYEKKMQRKKIRGYNGNPPRTEVKTEFLVNFQVNQEAVDRAVERLGWRVYVTNAPKKILSLSQVILTYRDSFIIERGFGRLKGKPLSLTPMFLQREDHIIGLVRLLSIGLRIITLLEFVVRRRLASKEEELVGLNSAAPKRKTNRPTTEAILRAFLHITLTIWVEHKNVRCHITSLSPLQNKLLSLLDFPKDLYLKIASMPP